MQVGLSAAYECIKVFSETDLTEDLKRIDVPTLIIHDDDDRISPIGASAHLSSKIVKNATLKVYPGRPTACSRRIATNSTPTCWSFWGKLGRVPELLEFWSDEILQRVGNQSARVW